MAGRPANQAKLEIDYQQGDWMARDPTAKLMPNAINFGPAMPGKKYTAHNAKEFKEVADLDADMQMFTEMLLRIGNLKQMQ